MQGRLVHPFVTRCIDGVAQVFDAQVGVDLRGGDAGVVHELLHVAQGHAGGDHVVAEGVTQVVPRKSSMPARLSAAFLALVFSCLMGLSPYGEDISQLLPHQPGEAISATLAGLQSVTAEL
jgi:hypothetical protein